ncbi:MAG: carboxypeptidase-like regulatory domain-containing protein [Candidatus Acidiferrales bacterium]|jgi:hypothetical protein
MHKKIVTLLIWLLVSTLDVALSARLMAQTAATGAIKGTVTDSSGAVVPNVTVAATNNGTGVTRTVMTEADGSYVITLLPLGSYKLKFDAAGFKPGDVASVTVNVTETAVLNPVLEVGSQTQEVTVQAEAEEVQTSDPTMGDVVASTTATTLPLTTRNYTNLLGLSAGANASVFNATALGKGTTDIAVNGASTYQNGISMDGVSIVNNSANGLLSDSGNSPGLGLVNPDAIQEFKIQTSLFDAGYGRKVGASVNVVTKSGTNDFHGSAFEFFRNTVLNANDFFRKESPAVNGVPNDSRQVLDQNQYGGVFGGPIKKDKLFFFTSFQETSQRNGAASQGYSAPSLLPIFPGGDRSNTAALTASLGATFCPGGTDGGSPGNGKPGAAVQVACNGSNINPVAISILQLKNPDGTYAIPSSIPIVGNGITTTAQNTTFTIPAQFTEHQILANGDYVINSKNTLSARYFLAHDPVQVSFSCGNSGGAPGICYPDTALTEISSNHYAILKLTSILTNNLVNESRISLQRDTYIGTPDNPFTNTQVGIQSILPQVNNLDAITVSGLFTAGSSGTLPSSKYVTNWEAGDELSWTHGKQTLRFGGEFERDRLNWTFKALSVGSLTFQTIQDFLLGLPGCAPAAITAGTCGPTKPGNTNGTATSNISNSGNNQAALPPGGLVHQYREPYGDGYVQDDIKIRPRFTLNLGLRWEYIALFYDKNGLGTNIWPVLINAVPIPGTTPATGTLAGFVVPSNFNFAEFPAPPVGGVFQNSHKVFTQGTTPLDDFAPRVGFAWSPLASNRLAIRGGGGFFYDRAATNYIGGIEQGEPYSVNVFQSGTANYYSTFAVPYQGASLSWSPRWVNFATGSSSNLSQVMAESTYPTPVVYQWNMVVQYEFLPHWTLETGYVGSRGVHQEGLPGLVNQQLNEAQLVGNPLGTNTIVAPGIAAGLVTTNTVANASLRVPYLGFAPAGMLDFANDTDTKFNSLQVTLRKQLSHGLQAQAAYSFSRGVGTDWVNSDANVSRYGPNPLYHPQRFTISYLWDLPTISHEGFLGKVANGWGVSGVTIAQDGTPLTITDTRGGTIFGFGPGTPISSTAEYCAGMGAANAPSSGSLLERLGGVNGGQGYINKSAFCTTPAIGNGTGYGDAGLGILLGPGQFNWDMSLIKTTKVGGIREDGTLQFRAEFFNAFNHPQFNNPGVVDVSKSNVGQITTASVNPRLIQFALKYAF